MSPSQLWFETKVEKVIQKICRVNIYSLRLWFYKSLIIDSPLRLVSIFPFFPKRFHPERKNQWCVWCHCEWSGAFKSHWKTPQIAMSLRSSQWLNGKIIYQRLQDPCQIKPSKNILYKFDFSPLFTAQFLNSRKIDYQRKRLKTIRCFLYFKEENTVDGFLQNRKLNEPAPIYSLPPWLRARILLQRNIKRRKRMQTKYHFVNK